MIPEIRGKTLCSEDEEDAEIPWWVKNPSRRSHTKIEFPKFEGGDPCGWILKAENISFINKLRMTLR